MNLLFRALLLFNSAAPLLVAYIVYSARQSPGLGIYVLILVCTTMPLVLTHLITMLCSYSGSDPIAGGTVESVESKVNTPYFNPTLLLLGYKYYRVVTRNGKVIALISRRTYLVPADVDVDRAYRLSNCTYIEVEK